MNDSNLEYSTPLNASKVSHNQINREKKKALARTTQPQKLPKIHKRDGFSLFYNFFFFKKTNISWPISLSSRCTIKKTYINILTKKK